MIEEEGPYKSSVELRLTKKDITSDMIQQEIHIILRGEEDTKTLLRMAKDEMETLGV